MFSPATPESSSATATPGNSHLTGALHAWCGAHLLRDLKDLYDFEPGKQDWASRMAALLIEARGAARDARAAGSAALDPEILGRLVTRYRALAADGLTANIYRRTATAGDARRIARRFLNFEDMILQDVREIPCHGRVGHVVALALHDVAGEPRRRVRNSTGRSLRARSSTTCLPAFAASAQL